MTDLPPFAATPRPATSRPATPRVPDPGTPTIARLAGILVVVLIAAVALAQQLGGSVLKGASPPHAAAVEPPGAQDEITAKILLKLRPLMPQPLWDAQIEQTLAPTARTPEGALRLATIKAELDRPDQPPFTPSQRALDAIDAAVADLPEDAPLRADARLLATLYQGQTLAPDDADALRQRHGWYATLALAHNLASTDPARQHLTAGGQAIALLLAVVAIVVPLAMLVGLGLLITYLVQRFTGRWRDRFIPPAPGGSVAIETVAVFVAGFLLLKAATAAIAGVLSPDAALWTALIAQWLLLLAVLWPTFRGVPRQQAFRLLGLHKGQGIAKEIALGLVGYLACLPIFAAGAILTIILLFLWTAIRTALGAPPPTTPQNPIIDLVSGGQSVLALVLVTLLASLWAPLAEETIFRGGLYRHLRTRLPIVIAAILTALAFGLMHGYPVIMLGPVIALGFAFSLMREWRDSLIGPMVAHCLHNATVLAFLITLTRLVG